jgi:uncharacterized membrane protein
MRVAWPDRSRDVTPPASALSAKIVVEDAGSNGADIEWTANRSANAAAHTQTYGSGQAGTVGSHHIVVQFYSAENGEGSLVGTASFTEVIPAGGVIASNVTVNSTVASVSVPAGQSVTVGTPKFLDVVAKDESDNVIALQPGATFWTVTEGQDRLEFEEAMAKGLLSGAATVTARVDGKTSEPGNVQVLGTADFLLLGLMRGNTGAPAFNGVSGDGTTMVGSAFINTGGEFGDKPFRWTRAGGYEELQTGFGATNASIAMRANADGSQIVGYAPGNQTMAWVWRNGTTTRIFPIVISDFTAAYDISDDGKVIVGAVKQFGAVRALRWRNVNQWDTLWASDEFASSQAISVSADGTIVVGSATRPGSPDVSRVMVQRELNPPTEVPLPTGVKSMHPSAVSGDGQVVVGMAIMDNGQNKPFRWSQAEGTMVFDTVGVATTCNTDGSIVMGNNGETTFVWTATGGMKTLEAYAAARFGLSVPGQPKMGRLVSDNGNTFSGGVAPYEEFYEKPWVIIAK